MKLCCARRRSPIPPSRRDFLSAISAAAAATSLAPRFGALSFVNPFSAMPVRAATLAADPLRPQFHLLPAKNWMNDPNGPSIGKACTTCFSSTTRRSRVGRHALGARHQPGHDPLEAFTRGPRADSRRPGPDGCFSGSAVDDRGMATFIYTGVSTPRRNSRHASRWHAQFSRSTVPATSDDAQLRSWNKLKQPVSSRPPIRCSPVSAIRFCGERAASGIWGSASGIARKEAKSCFIVRKIYGSGNM